MTVRQTQYRILSTGGAFYSEAENENELATQCVRSIALCLNHGTRTMQVHDLETSECVTSNLLRLSSESDCSAVSTTDSSSTGNRCGWQNNMHC